MPNISGLSPWATGDIATASKMNSMMNVDSRAQASTANPAGSSGDLLVRTDLTQLSFYTGGAWNAMPTLSTNTFTGGQTATLWAPSGLTGSTAASRIVGGTTGGAPASGTFAVGDFVVDQTGRTWVCTTAGTPGTWIAGGITQIASTTLSVAATNITFSGIPGTNKHLMIFFQSRGDTAATSEFVDLQCNSDTAANYSSNLVYTSTASWLNQAWSGQTYVTFGLESAATAAANYAGGMIIHIPNYAGTTFFKQITATGWSGGSAYYFASGGQWNSTAAITTIKLFPHTSTNFVLGATATLYGYN